jgi:hypothetical protein
MISSFSQPNIHLPHHLVIQFVLPDRPVVQLKLKGGICGERGSTWKF